MQIGIPVVEPALPLGESSCCDLGVIMPVATASLDNPLGLVVSAEEKAAFRWEVMKAGFVLSFLAGSAAAATSYKLARKKRRGTVSLWAGGVTAATAMLGTVLIGEYKLNQIERR